MAESSKGKQKKVQVVSFLSGKGGAGKTSASIGAAYLLSDAGFNVLLIDFDFATNGASYFWKYLYPSHEKTIGLYELIYKKGLHLDKITVETEDIFLQIRDRLVFIPSRVSFSQKLPLRDSIIMTEDVLGSFLLSLIDSVKDDFDFIIIDNQAGANLTAKAAASVSNKVIIVSELDPISSDTVDTLLIQIGEALPEYRRHLINKLDIRETEQYKDLATLFQSMNRLPPLPFDFDVRAAFASREIPVDVEKPTTFFIALYNTVNAFVPEYREQMVEYGNKILSKFTEYQDRLHRMIDRTNELKAESATLRRKREKSKLKVSWVIAIVLVYFSIAVGVASTIFEWFPRGEYFPLIFAILLGGISLTYLVVSRLQYRERTEDIIRSEEIQSELSKLEKEVERYESLMLTRTKEFLLHFAK